MFGIYFASMVFWGRVLHSVEFFALFHSARCAAEGMHTRTQLLLHHSGCA